MADTPTPFNVVHDGVTLSGEVAGDGPPVLLLHGLTATRRYVLHGSRALERAGYRVISFDARGHGKSTGPDDMVSYDYASLAADALAVLDTLGASAAALVGHSMGAATAVTVALATPERVAALVLITPAHRGVPSPDLERFDRLADGLEQGGPDGFLEALGPSDVGDRYSETVRTVIRQRLVRHARPETVAQALRATPRTTAFDGLDALHAVRAPTLVVGSRDDADPGHPFSVAESWASRIPGARLEVEVEGESPLAWRGGTLSALIASVLGPIPRWS